MGPTKVYIDHSNLIHNLKLIQKAVAPAKIMGVVKADAYGHGSVEAAKTLVKNGVDYLGVGFLEEGIQLRDAGIDAPILVFGTQLVDFFEYHIRYNLDITLSGEHQIKPLREICRKLNKKARVHIKVDTGMRRVGFVYNYIQHIVHEIFKEAFFDVAGVYSHFSSADEEDLSFTMFQLEQFQQVRNLITNQYKKDILFHIANSAAIMRLPQTHFDMVRPGIMLYGSTPGPEFNLTWRLKEVMRFVSQVAFILNLGPGEPISYNRRYYTDKETKIAIVPAGYADGFNRRLTNTGSVLIRGKRCPVVGAVCMDQIMVNIGNDSNIEIGDEVVLIGGQDNEHISIVEISRHLQTIPYEVTCCVSKRVKRIHLNE